MRSARALFQLCPRLCSSGGRWGSEAPAVASFHSSAEHPRELQSQEPPELDSGSDKVYIDRLKATARAGDGGSGCVSFWRKGAKGKNTYADGGNGGDGGDVVLRASNNIKSLAGVHQLLRAENGKHGQPQKSHGRGGKHAVVLVPLGTVVSRWVGDKEESVDGGGKEAEEQQPEWLQAWRRPWVGAQDYHTSDDEGSEGFNHQKTRKDATVGEEGHADTRRLVSSWKGGKEVRTEGYRVASDPEYEVIADLVEDGAEVVAAHGGRGGRGNAAARSVAHRPAASTAERAFPGESARLLLEVKLLADVALVGLPNVGKSSLLRALSAATPRVAAFAFTTLRPQLGTVMLGEGRRLALADVPGLIEGAHANRGLGHRFLRHVERAPALALVVALAGVDSEVAAAKTEKRPGGEGGRVGATLSPLQQVELLRRELAEYSPELLTRPWVAVASKTDLLPPQRAKKSIEALREGCSAAGAAAVIGTSAVKKTGLMELSVALDSLVQAVKLADSR